MVVPDPAVGLQRMDRGQFNKGWSGTLLTLTPTPHLSNVEESPSTFARFLPYITAHKKVLGEVLLASLLIQLFGLAVPLFTQNIVDRVLVQQNLQLLNMLLLGMVVVALFQAVLIDGVNIKHVSPPSLRWPIGVVLQDNFLFSGTIRGNIALGDPDGAMQDVITAAMLAGAHEFISELPHGYAAVIGERGMTLSGGQRQRLAIARALYTKPRILVLDEATSALDTESEKIIQRNLDKILHDRTTIVIAHRLSTVRNADIILVLDRGVIVERGTHFELMQKQGLYFYLNSQQLQTG